MKRVLSTLAVVLALLIVVLPSSAATRREKGEIERKRSENLERFFKRDYDKLNTSFAGRVRELAQWAAGKGLGTEAAELWTLAKSLDPDVEGDQPKAADAQPSDDDKAAFKNKKELVFDQQSNDLFKLGFNCYKAGLIGRAYDMVWETVRFNPDASKAQKLLGKVKYNDEWMGIYEAVQIKAGRVFKDEYGWVSKTDLAKYEQGLMPLKEKWLPREQVEQARSSWTSAWVLDTEHYHIRNNVGLADAVAFGKILEDNYKLFFRVFIGYFSSKSQTEMLFGNRQEKRLMNVNYFATKEEFQKNVGVQVGDGVIGLYNPMRRSASFYKLDWGTNVRVLKHEATHQLLTESRRGATGGLLPGAWVVEASSTYMETCYRKEGKIVTEGRNAGWVQAFNAIARAGKDMPLEDFDQLNYQAFQGAGIGYPEAAALACFLMEAEDGNYRERFLDYIEAHYTGRLGRGELEKFMGVSYNDLEDEFHKFILAAPAPQTPPPTTDPKKDAGKKDEPPKKPDDGKKDGGEKK